MNLAQMIERNVRRIPHWSAVLSETTNYTWEEYNRRVNMMGNALRKQGVSKGDRVAICLPNSPEYLVSYYAIVKLGAIAVPFNIMFKSSEVCYIVNNSEPKVMVALAGETMNSLMKRHPSKGEIPKAFITLKSDCQAIEAEIIAFCKERMAAYKAPRVVEFLTEFPKNYSGKIMKKELFNRYVNM